MLRSSMLVAALAVAVPVSALVAAPPTPEEIEAKTGAAMAYYREQGEKFDIESPEFIAVLDAQLADVDPAECGLEQIDGLEMLWLYSPNAKPIWMKRIRDLGNGDQWLDAALMLADMDDFESAMDIGMARGGLPAVPDERLGEVILALGGMDAEKVPAMQSELVILIDRMPDGGMAMVGWEEYPALLASAGVEKAARERIRKRVVAAFEKAAAEFAAAGDESMKAGFEASIDYLDGAAGRGELIGYAAPEIEFLWNSEGEEWKDFGSLQGKVVVVDFWATWCGPCIGSFPNVRELVDFYDGYDVVVLGVTSPQKRVIFRDDRGVVDVPDFEEECRLMAEYKTGMDMTWPVVMTKQNVFNPDFAIEGIPHVAIIGADGKVAYNGMHPAGDPAEKVEKINGLLEKAGKKTPGPWKPKAEKPNADQG